MVEMTFTKYLPNPKHSIETIFPPGMTVKRPKKSRKLIVTWLLKDKPTSQLESLWKSPRSSCMSPSSPK